MLFNKLVDPCLCNISANWTAMYRPTSQSEREFLSGLRQVSFSAADQETVDNRFVGFRRTSSLASIRNGHCKIASLVQEEFAKHRPRTIHTAIKSASLDSHDSGAWANFDEDKRCTYLKVRRPTSMFLLPVDENLADCHRILFHCHVTLLTNISGEMSKTCIESSVEWFIRHNTDRSCVSKINTV